MKLKTKYHLTITWTQGHFTSFAGLWCLASSPSQGWSAHWLLLNGHNDNITTPDGRTTQRSRRLSVHRRRITTPLKTCPRPHPWHPLGYRPRLVSRWTSTSTTTSWQWHRCHRWFSTRMMWNTNLQATEHKNISIIRRSQRTLNINCCKHDQGLHSQKHFNKVRKKTAIMYIKLKIKSLTFPHFNPS